MEGTIRLNDFATKQDLEELQIYLKMMCMQSGIKCTVDIADVAAFEGVSISFIKKSENRYLMPRFGESAYPTGPTRWSIEEFLGWRRRDPYERQQEQKALITKKLKETIA